MVRPRFSPIVALVGVTAVWGYTFVPVQKAVAVYPLFAFLAIRFAISSLALAPFAWRPLRSLPRAGYLAGCGAGVLLGSAYGLQTAGLELTTVSSTGFITGLYVVLTPLIALALFKTPVAVAAWVGVALSVSGLLMLSGIPGGSVAGNALVLGNAVAQSLQIVSMERFAPRYDARALTFLQMVVSSDRRSRQSPSRAMSCRFPATVSVWYALVVTGVFAGALGYLVATWVQSQATAARAALVFTLEAPFRRVLRGRAPVGASRAGRLAGLRAHAGGHRARRACGGRGPAPARTPAGGSLMDAVVLALCSAALFGGMTVALRPAIARGDDPLVGALMTVLPALCVALVAAAIVGDRDVGAVWPFALAGILGPGISQVLFTFAIRDAGPSRASATVGMAPLFAVTFAFVLLGEPLVAGILFGAILIVAGGILLAGERGRPRHVKTIGLVFALSAALVFAFRDTLVRRFSLDTSVAPELAISATLAAGAVTILVAIVATRRRPSFRSLPFFVPAGVMFGLSYVCALRGVLPRAAQRRRTARRDRVALGCRPLGAVPAARRGRRPTARRRRSTRRRRRNPDRPLPVI